MTATEERQDAARVRFPPPLVFLLAIGAGLALDEWVLALRLDAVDESLRLALGTSLVVLGLACVAFAFAHFKRTGQAPEPWTPTPEIISRGIYSYSRNPMYLGMALAQAGAGLLGNRLWILLLVPLSMMLTAVIAIRPEEAYLEEKFGEVYVSYKARVRRWL